MILSTNPCNNATIFDHTNAMNDNILMDEMIYDGA